MSKKEILNFLEYFEDTYDYVDDSTEGKLYVKKYQRTPADEICYTIQEIFKIYKSTNK